MPPESCAGYFSIGVGRQIDQPDALGDALMAVLLVSVLVLVGDAQADVLEHGHRVEQRAVLEDVPDVGAELRSSFRLSWSTSFPSTMMVPRVRLDQADDGA